MNISEKEIFNFIFFPEILDKEKFSFLSNTDLFKNEINLLRSIKENYNQNLSQEIIEKIISKISELGSNRIIRLEKKKHPLQNNAHQLVLAADSQIKNSKQKIETFEDENSAYLVKVIMEEDLTKIYLFTRNNQEHTNLKVNL
ncbi:MAG: hypothetical protein OQJ81_09555, partial [Melioribacteraceae bacterium]|nr:hypothetical protein [Melioribacteraceae bacterium]